MKNKINWNVFVTEEVFEREKKRVDCLVDLSKESSKNIFKEDFKLFRCFNEDRGREVLYDSSSNKILHFKYAPEAMGPLNKVGK